MTFTTETQLFCDNNATSTLCYYPSEEIAEWLNSSINDYQTGSLISVIFLGTILFFVVSIFMFKIIRK